MFSLRSAAVLCLTIGVLVTARPALAHPTPAASTSASPAPASPAPSAAPHSGGGTIFDYQKQLGLSDDQVKKIHAEFDAMQTRRRSNGQKVRALGQQINGMIKAAPIPELKAKLQQYYAMQLDMELDDIQTSRRINAIMTPEQLTKWEAIKAKARATQPGAPH